MAFARSIRLRPIGFVRTESNLEELKHRTAISQLVIDRRLRKALDGIDGFSHVFVIYWMHQTQKLDRTVLKVHPRHCLSIPEQGVFATRSCFRPNTIALTLVRLLRRTGNTLIVRGLDTYDGTPLLDLKPYDYWDRIEKIRVPAWWKKLEKERRQG